MKTQQLTQIALIGEQRVFIDALAHQFESDTKLAVVGLGSPVENGLSDVILARPHLVILDVDSPVSNAIDIAKQVRDLTENTKLVLLVGRISAALIQLANEVAVDGILSKAERLNILADSIHQIAAGESRFSPNVEQYATYDPKQNRYALLCETPLATLSEKQVIILRHFAHGASAKNVAQRLGLSKKSVECHKQRIMYKLGLHDRVHLTRFAIREGLIEP